MHAIVNRDAAVIGTTIDPSTTKSKDDRYQHLHPIAKQSNAKQRKAIELVCFHLLFGRSQDTGRRSDQKHRNRNYRLAGSPVTDHDYGRLLDGVCRLRVDVPLANQRLRHLLAGSFRVSQLVLRSNYLVSYLEYHIVH